MIVLLCLGNWLASLQMWGGVSRNDISSALNGGIMVQKGDILDYERIYIFWYYILLYNIQV